MASTTNLKTELDPYTAKAQNDDLTPQKKVEGLRTILEAVKTGMLTTRDKDGALHARAMTPVAPSSETDLTVTFIANNASHKFDELENDANVNVSFYDTATTNWASFAGTAKVSSSTELVKKHWNPIISGYFGDLKDGVHNGGPEDPRVAVIEVVPNEIRFFLTHHGTIARTLQTAFSAATGKTSVPGELVTITQAEIQLTQGLHTKTA